MIDIVMTATLRPDILRKTLNSFCENLFVDQNRFRLLLNIDLAGDKGINPFDVLDVAASFFPKVVYRFVKAPSFPLAIRWGWSMVESEFLFHIEDDWLMTRSESVDNMVGVMRKHPTLCAMRFPKFGLHKNEFVYGKPRCNWTYDNGVYIAENRKTMFSFNPCIVRGEFVAQIWPYIVDGKDPEYQLRYEHAVPEIQATIDKFDKGIYGDPDTPPLIKDLGNEWRTKMGLSKGEDRFGRSPNFTTWSKEI